MDGTSRATTDRRRRRVVAIGGALVLLAATTTALTHGTLAAWVIATSNSGNQFGTAASFPNYPTSVTTDGAWAYLRNEEVPSSGSTVVALDSSGNNRLGTFNGVTNGPSTWWKLDDGSGTTAADSSGGANTGTLTNSPSWTSGPNGGGLSFNGTTNYVAGASAPVHTNASLTVAAWVYLSSTASDGYVVSQNGTHTAAYTLGFDAATSKFAFRMSDTDTVGATIKTQYSRLVSAGYWYHLVGVYNSVAAKIYVYVDGIAIGNSAKTSNWDAVGSLQVGRGYRDDAWAGYFNGSVDDVRVYDRALSATEITNLAAGNPATRWDFSEASGSTTADTGYRANTGTVGSAASFTAGHVGNAISVSNSSNGYVAGIAPAVRTDKSLSVSAWVNLNSFGTGAARTAVAQAGTTSSGFILKYDSSGKWAFTMPETDAVTPTPDQITSAFGAATNTWVHLVGVFDSTAQTIALYVNGTSQGTVAHTAAFSWDATGALQVGRSLWDGSYADAWWGKVDSVRVYQRALSQSDVTALFNDTEPAATWTEAPMALGVPGALQGTYQALGATTGVAFAGSGSAYENTSTANPTTFTVECWFRVSGTQGGELIGLHQNSTNDTGSHDRSVYVDSGGRVSFATYVASAQTVRSTSAYNDGVWHHAAASLGAAGMKLYVDGALVASNAGFTTAGNYTGYWRWGGGTLANLTNRPSSDYLIGSIDEVAIYTTQLTDTQVKLHYQRNY